MPASIESLIVACTPSIYVNVNVNDDKNQTTIEHNNIIVPALLMKENDLSNTSRATYEKEGALYSGNSLMKEECSPLNMNFLNNAPKRRIIAIAIK